MRTKVLRQSNKFTKAIFEYETNKIVQINSMKIGILLRSFQLIIFVYIIGYVMIFMRGYQDKHGLTSSVVVKVKGIGSSKQEINRKMWDIPDMIVPPQEKSAVFITTHMVETRNQTQSTCAEDYTVPGVKCNKDSDCKKDVAVLLGSDLSLSKSILNGIYTPLPISFSLNNKHGVMTGRCIVGPHNINTCEITAWCPLENDTLVNPLNSILKEVTNFTILVKNSIIFDTLNVQRSNLFAWENRAIPKFCLFDPNDPLLKYCPIFRVSSLLGSLNSHDLNQLLIHGGIIQMVISWECDLDFSEQHCKPVYTFNRLDPKDGKLSKGWNFRYSNYYTHNNKEYRTLFKVFGLRILFEVRGTAGKFSAITFTMNLGSGLALLAVATLICDFIIIFVLPNRMKYFNSKYELHDDDDAYQGLTENGKAEATK